MLTVNAKFDKTPLYICVFFVLSIAPARPSGWIVASNICNHKEFL